MVTMIKMPKRWEDGTYDMGFAGLSTDVKPKVEYEDMRIANGSSFFEFDKLRISFYDISTANWKTPRTQVTGTSDSGSTSVESKEVIADKLDISVDGSENTVEQVSSAAIGSKNVVSGRYSFAVGASNIINSGQSFAVGIANTVSRTNSMALGNHLVNTGIETVLAGHDNPNIDSSLSSNFPFQVGNGLASDNKRTFGLLVPMKYGDPRQIRGGLVIQGKSTSDNKIRYYHLEIIDKAIQITDVTDKFPEAEI